MSAQRTTGVVIVGGGLSGLLTAANLLREARQPLSICIVERDLPLGRGMAYRTTCASHLLNTPAIGNSVVKGDPEHFLRWMRARVPKTEPHTFVSRLFLAEYLRAVLAAAEASSKPGVRLEVVQGEAVSARCHDGGVTLGLRDGGTIWSRVAVFATGHEPPSDPAEVVSLRGSPRYTPSVWLGLPPELDAAARILLIGAGLTMVDTVLGLAAAGHRGPIEILSRRGLLPIALPDVSTDTLTAPRRAPAARLPSPKEDVPSQPVRLRRVLRTLREMKTLSPTFSTTGFLRTHGEQLWGRLSDSDQRRFTRHVKPFWDNVRYLVPHLAAKRFDDIVLSGRVSFHAGRILSARESDGAVAIEYRPRYLTEIRTLSVQHVMNCTGPSQDYGSSADPLLSSLRRQGFLRAHASGMGLEVGNDGSLVGTDAMPSSVLFTLGPPCKGSRWETTSIGSCAIQADALARRLLAQIENNQAPQPAEMHQPLQEFAGVMSIGVSSTEIAFDPAPRRTGTGSP